MLRRRLDSMSIQQNSNGRFSSRAHELFNYGCWPNLQYQASVSSQRASLRSNLRKRLVTSLTLMPLLYSWVYFPRRVIIVANRIHSQVRLLMMSFHSSLRRTSQSESQPVVGSFQISVSLILSCPLIRVYGVFIDRVLTKNSYEQLQAIAIR